jgi:hypothetical protein
MALTKIRIEVLKDEQAARERAAWMTARGFTILLDGNPTPREKVIYDAIAVTGVKDIAGDEDGEVWIVIGEKA